ncbi:Clc protein 2 [Trichostrongylus colubriformis]|uniref:Clc protein 2 n=1 Tax=Trichostrongylus colubriformis TaxID=6319 RepID=A0AAN8IAH8_TRICO
MASAKVLLHVPAAVFAILGLIITFVALATPSWQVVYARELQQWLQSGLWMSCRTRPSGMYMCSYAFSQNEYGGHTPIDVLNQDAGDLSFYSWQRTLLHVFLVGQLFSILCLLAFCLSQSWQFERVACAVSTAFIALAALLCGSGVVTFAIYSQMVKYRFYQVSVSGIYEKHLGYSFYVATIGFLFYLVSFCLSLFYTIYVIRKPQLNYGNVGQGREQPHPVYGMPQFSQQDFYAMKKLPPTPY